MKKTTMEKMIVKYEESGSIVSELRDSYISTLEELYKLDPHKYFNKWYFFKNFPDVDLEDYAFIESLLEIQSKFFSNVEVIEENLAKYMPELYH